MAAIGVIGGSGLYEIEGLEDIEYKDIDTPWGKPSDSYVTGTLSGTSMVFLPRHGRVHKIMPSDINYRANIYGMKSLGVDSLISVSAVGSMKGEIAQGDVVLPDQFIDFTKKRETSFFGDGVVAHVSMADPVCHDLAGALYEVLKNMDANVHMGGTYICIEGPQFSSKSESHLFRSWGVDVIGMTNMPEAKLAREAEICYSTLALSTDYDCWHEGHDNVTVEDVIKILLQNAELAREVIKNFVSGRSLEKKCNCCDSLQNAIITQPQAIDNKAKEKYKLLIGKYIK
ncbi:MAG: S-methyl-5'-thioadenosine phosphorylase [Candidatus Dadabacteria bacterium]|nr:S-methyl-5'-thioadenosine phosphorylase [Candidatus Dadabacteria bacterium]NIS09156.1 S-methyl-5'-thioadenosine phosphorylase [Candidatus Dadabacteria bacterium]NIY22463.1 S-methyl-5'-thioadenosine phosphorylase [Candidatus Dadabacteria bacterium]